MTTSGWGDARRILAVRLDTIGDVLMTTPALRALREGRPRRRITLLTSSAGSAIAPLIPEIDDVIVHDAPWLKATAPRADARPDLDMIERLRERRFDAAVVFTVFSQNPLPSAMLCFLADIPRRLAHCHENPYQLLTHWVPDPEPAEGVRHEVRRQLDLVAAVGCRTSDERLSLRVPADARERVRALLGTLGVDRDAPWIVIHPGATAPSRRYPPARFAEAADRLVAELGCRVLLTGSAGEAPLIAELAGAMRAPAVSLAGRLSLAELAALIAEAPVLVSNNTGPAHIAAAVGTPVVDLYALTNPQHTPWQVPSRVLSHDVPCKYCYRSVCPKGHNACLTQVSPESVARAARELLSA